MTDIPEEAVEAANTSRVLYQAGEIPQYAVEYNIGYGWQPWGRTYRSLEKAKAKARRLGRWNSAARVVPTGIPPRVPGESGTRKVLNG